MSGPPGTLKESVAVGVVSSFVQRSEEVLFVGEFDYLDGLHNVHVSRSFLWSTTNVIADAQNMVGPSALIKALSSESRHFG